MGACLIWVPDGRKDCICWVTNDVSVSSSRVSVSTSTSIRSAENSQQMFVILSFFVLPLMFQVVTFMSSLRGVDSVEVCFVRVLICSWSDAVVVLKRHMSESTLSSCSRMG